MASENTFTDVPYVPNGGESQRLDLYLPEGKGKHPLIVYIHGGAFMFGDKKSPLMPKRLIAKGYAIASLNYRLSGEAKFPAAVEDCKAAVRWLRAHSGRYALDPNRFVAWGESAGAYMAVFLGTAGATKEFDKGEYLQFSSAVEGVVDYYGPTDFGQMDAHVLPGGQEHGTAGSPESKFLGATVNDNPELVRQADPIVYITKKAPPFFIAHGDNDHTVPYNQSELLYAALQKAGVPSTLLRVKGAEHVFGGATPEQRAEIDRGTDEFLEKCVGSGQ
jgi:acetyl esterase/lipase